MYKSTLIHISLIGQQQYYYYEYPLLEHIFVSATEGPRG